MRLVLLVLAVIAAVVLAGCGGSSGETLSVGDQTVTVPSDAHGLTAELEAFLDQLPYQHWYTSCVVKRVEKQITPAEAEALSELPEAERERKLEATVGEAGPACEAQSGRPVIDPNASSQELDLLRAGYATSMTTLAESKGLDANQTACVEKGAGELPEKQVIAIGNGSDKLRERILLSVFEPCAKVK